MNENENIDSSQMLVFPTKGKNRKSELQAFADKLQEISRKIGFKVSSRGWCYQLEGFNVITKDQFDKVQKVINLCRKQGYLPLDFTAQDESRIFDNIQMIEEDTPAEKMQSFLSTMLNYGKYHDIDMWEDEEYFIQILVEKIDLKTLFKPVCKKYHIAIGNSRGWSDIMQRANMIEDFKEAEEQGKTCVLLYCGDHDPYGLAISDFLKKNINDLKDATGYNADDLIIDRFGLNYDFIDEHNLTWIDNLISGSGKQPDYSKPIVKKYIDEFGERKVEANAIIVDPESARNLCEQAILNYVGEEIHERFKERRQAIVDKYNQLFEDLELKTALENAYQELESYEQESDENEDDEDENEDDEE